MLAFDPVYFLFVGPAILLALWAQFRVKSAYARASRVPNSSGLSGAQAAARILERAGCRGVGIEMTHGMLSDHYDPRAKVLRLSEAVYHGRDLAAVGIAAHEAGHAIQDARRYGPLVVRNGLVPLASTGSWLSMILITVGFLLMSGAQHSGPGLGQTLLLIGVGAFGLTVVFQIVNLPVEFDASARAREVLLEGGIIRQHEMGEVSRVLNAAAMTYVAATITAVMQLLYFLWRSGLLGGHRRD